MSCWLRTALVTVVIALASCVTVNVYFPAAAAEKAADRIIEDVWGREGQPPAARPQEAQPEPSSMLLHERLPRMLVASTSHVIDLVVPVAAAQADLDVTSPAIRQLTAAMEARHAQLEKHYASGAVGLTPDGLVTLRDANAVPLPERMVVNKLLAEENANRNALYAEIARANGHPEWEADIRSTFAQRWVAKARGGWWHKNAAGQWVQK